MNIYEKLDIIDDYERKFGIEKAVLQSCAFMIDYLSDSSVVLPKLARDGLEAAIQYRDGANFLERVDQFDHAILNFLRENSAVTDYESPEFRGLHCVRAVLASYKRPDQGARAWELVSIFLDVLKPVDTALAQIDTRLEKYFL